MSEGAEGVVINNERILEEQNVFTGAAAISASISPGKRFQLIGFHLHMSAAPTTSESFTVTKNAGLGAAYDTLLYSLDLSSGSTTDIVYYFDIPIKCHHLDDAIDFAYTNTDAGTYGLVVYWRTLKG